MANLNVPYSNEVLDEQGLLSRVWQQFFRLIEDALNYLGTETSIPLVNNQVAPANLIKFDKAYTSGVFFEYLIQRITDSSELVELGEYTFWYMPSANSWFAARPFYSYTGSPTDISLGITADGQVYYTSTNQAGVKILSRIVFRKREIAAKSSLYSKVG